MSRRVAALVITAALVAAGAGGVDAQDPRPSAGPIRQLEGRAGCFTAAVAVFRERCARARGMFGPDSAVVSPDGRNVYVAARDPDNLIPIGSSSVVSFARDSRSGALRQIDCISDDGGDGRDGTDGVCRDGDALRSANSIAISPDGRSLYVTSDEGQIAIFSRGAGGRLTQVGCVKDVAVDTSCADGFAMPRPVSLTVSSDGRNVYATSRASHALLVFARSETDGLLREIACVSDDGTDGQCADGRGMQTPTAVTSSPDGRNVYVTSGRQQNALTVFARDTETGAVTQTGCFLEVRSRTPACLQVPGLADASGVAVSPDGRSVYVTAIDSETLSTFARNPADGTLHQIDCIASPGTFERRACRRGPHMSFSAAVAVTADGRRVVAIAAGSNNIAAYRRDRASGRLSLEGCVEWRAEPPSVCARGRALFGAKGLAVSPRGDSAYVTADTDRSLAVFRLRAPNG